MKEFPPLFNPNEEWDNLLAYAKKSLYDQAIGDYNQALALSPNYAHAYWGRGYAYASKGEYDKTIEDYTKAIAIDPQEAGPYHGRGTVYSKKGLHDKAITDFRTACKKGNSNSCKEVRSLELQHPSLRSSVQNFSAVVSKPAVRKKPEKQRAEQTVSLGRYKVVRSTPLLKEPHGNAAVITRLRPGTKINVTKAMEDYLRVESKYNRPPGYVSPKDVVSVR